MTKDDKAQIFFDNLSADIERMKFERTQRAIKHRDAGGNTDEVFAILQEKVPPKLKSVASIQHDRTLCYYCNKPLNKGTIDHIIPTSKQGKNNTWNRLYACSKCNVIKSNFSLEEFINLVMYTKLTPKKYTRTVRKYVIKRTKKLIKYRDTNIEFMQAQN